MGIRKKIKKYLTFNKKKENQYILKIDKEKRFQEKVVLVTGGSGAIGRAACIKFAMEGGKVYFTGTNQVKINETIDAIIRLGGGKCTGVVVHVDDYESVKSAVDYIIRNEDKIDILVNCAGGSAREKGEALDAQDLSVIKNVIDTNLLGTIYCCKCVIPTMKKNRYGKIINISSMLGIAGKKYHTEYSAAKAGIIATTRSLAMELGEYCINVNCVTPGLVQREAFIAKDAYIYSKTNYLDRVCKPTDVANLICFLASDESDFITGSNYIIDGGRGLGCKGDG
ncbi:MAG: SDR family oxidoreductase [Lachnospiraceae bacterium]|nr:SDR family oxidoreductase [Lachnospiraceae bacterium]